MNKTLLNSYDSFVSFVDAHIGMIPGHGNVVSDFWVSPEKYPCVVIWGIRYDENGPDELYGEFVYLDDFETPEEAYEAAIKHCLENLIK